MKSSRYYVYILASRKNGTLYIGITNNLERRLIEHKSGKIKGFTETCHVDRLVYYEETDDVSFAIKREKQLKEWKRAWKIKLIEKENPYWEEIVLR